MAKENKIRIDEIMKLYWALEHAKEELGRQPDAHELVAIVNKHLNTRLAELGYGKGTK